MYSHARLEEKNIQLKKIVVELYLHYLSISSVSKFSTVRASLKKAITGILGIKESSSSATIASKMHEFTQADLSGLNFHARYISQEEERPSRFRLGGLFCFPGGESNYLKFLCKNAHKAIDNFDKFNLGQANGNSNR